jgi:hypothetical protein
MYLRWMGEGANASVEKGRTEKEEYAKSKFLTPYSRPIQPPWVPPNCRFEIDDVEEDWTYKSVRTDP